MPDPQSFAFTSSSLSTSAFSSTKLCRKFICARREKRVHVASTAARTVEYLENIAESMQQSIQKDNNAVTLVVPNNPVWGITKEKIKEISDAPSNSPLPLIHISRVLKGIPQSPHFFQLRRFSELTREKLEAAWDQAFEDTAEKIHDLKAKDFWVSAGKLWKTMGDLQGMGYNVIPIRRRLVEMTEVMVEFKQSKMEILNLKNKAEDHRLERSRLQSMVLSFQLRAEREGVNMVRLLGEVDQMEKELPKYEVLIANLAMEPFDVDV